MLYDYWYAMLVEESCCCGFRIIEIPCASICFDDDDAIMMCYFTHGCYEIVMMGFTTLS